MQETLSTEDEGRVTCMVHLHDGVVPCGTLSSFVGGGPSVGGLAASADADPQSRRGGITQECR